MIGRRRTVAFGLGALTLAGALFGPLDAAADHSLAAHMAQHLLVGVVAPALIALGAPMRLLLGALPTRDARRLVRLLRRVRPVVVLPLSAATLLAVHLTPAFDAALRMPVLHALEHALLFWTALAGWVVLIGVDPVPHAPGAIGRLAWMTVTMTAMGVVGAVLVSAGHPVFAHYPGLPDQRLAGTIMWIGGGLLLVPATVALCAHALWREEMLQRRRERAR